MSGNTNHACGYGALLALILLLPSFTTALIIAASFPVGLMRFGIVASFCCGAAGAFVLGRLSASEILP